MFSFSWWMGSESSQYLKEQPNKIFCLSFVHEWLPSKLLTRYLKAFQIWLKVEEKFAIFDWLSAIFYSGELILPVLFCMESCNSSHHLLRGVTNVWIVLCRNSGLPFNTEVDTPRIVYYGKSLLPVLFIAGSHWWQRGVTDDSGEFF